ncbi:uncharacterized protein LOC132280098 [Cornus florida]|uniref:uncharacterized protein LOC132280098 n=1 Tax=Cornus florida TaxID=4283 RepID=UPI002897D33C|nr:uncharacterized protein LOC132280098 [Cornus florida]
MNCQSNARNQRAKGFKVKHAVQFVLLLACCIWLAYQIKQSHDQRRDNGASMQSKLSEKHGAMALGRKGNAGWSSSGGESDSENVVDLVKGFEKKEEGGVGDDELDRNVEERAETHIEEPQNAEKNLSTLIQDEDEAVEKNDEDKGPSKIEEKNLVPPGGSFNTSFPIQHEIEDDIHGFNDENGIPQDGSGVIIESIPTWATGDHKNILSRQIISSSDNQSGIIESITSEREIVETKEGISSADAETENRSILEESENEEPTNAKIDAETSVASGIDHPSEQVQEKSIVSEDSHSVSSQEELEDVTDNSMFPQAE